MASNNDLIVDKSFVDFHTYQNYGSNGDGVVYFAGNLLVGGVEVDMEDYKIEDQGVGWWGGQPIAVFRDHDDAMLYYVTDYKENITVIAPDGSSTVVEYLSYRVGVVDQNTKEVIEIYDFNFDYDAAYHAGADTENSCYGDFLGISLLQETPPMGGNGNQNYRGTKDDDFYRAGDGNDTLSLGGGNDYGDGGRGDDTLYGQKGDDILQGGFGSDILDGGLGNDTADYRTSNQGVSVHLDGTISGGPATDLTVISHATGDTLISIENLSGSSLADTLYGNEVDNVLIGRKGDDTFWGGGGNDIFDGGEGFDSVSFSNSGYISVSALFIDLSAGTIIGATTDGDTYISIEGWVGTELNDTMSGDENSNSFAGGDGDDILSGLEGDDFLWGNSGVDIVTGGDGNDIFGFDILYAYNDAGIIEGDRDIIMDFVTGEDKFDLSLLDAKVGPENFDFDPNSPPPNDSFSFIGAAEFTAGVQGELRYAHENGNTVIYAEVTGDGIADYAIELTGIHYLTLADFTAPSLKLSIYGTDNGETINGTTDSDTIYAQAGDDIIYGGDGDDTIFGGSGDDHIYGGYGEDTAFGGDGDDIFYDTHGSTDIMDGGNGIDTLDISTSSVGATIDLMSGTVDWNNSLYEVATNFENVNSTSGDDLIYGTAGVNIIDGNDGDDSIFGGDGSDTLNGGVGADILYGGHGDDVITGHTGVDYMDGGLGIDTVNFDYSTEDVDTDLELGLSTFASGTVETTINFENVIGSAGNNVLNGTTGNNILDGNNGDDTLIGKTGNDILTGGVGLDKFVFSAGDGQDTITDFNPLEDSILIDGVVTLPFIWGSGVTVVEQVSSSDGPELLITYGQGDTVLIQNVSLSMWAAAEFNVIEGTALDDVLVGTAIADYIDAGGGADEVTSGDGDDVVYGGLGADIVWLGVGSDVFYDESEVGTGGSDIVYGGNGIDRIYGGGGDDQFFGESGKDKLYGGKGKDTLKGGSGNDVLKGGNGADILKGGSKDDSLFGSNGIDLLDGGSGNDNLSGGSGADVFYFNMGDEIDTIKDFEDGIDTIDLSATSLTFADLIITDSVDGVIVNYSTNGTDQITLTGIDMTAIDQTDFLFA